MWLKVNISICKFYLVKIYNKYSIALTLVVMSNTFVVIERFVMNFSNLLLCHVSYLLQVLSPLFWLLFSPLFPTLPLLFFQPFLSIFWLFWFSRLLFYKFAITPPCTLLSHSFHVLPTKKWLFSFFFRSSSFFWLTFLFFLAPLLWVDLVWCCIS